jgi:5-methylcytosine-specific restriction endonuclease McrA
MARSSGRSGFKWRQLVKALRQPGCVCWLCGHGIDLQAEPRTKWSFSVDHVTPLSRGGDPLDRANARTAHYGCNSSRKDRMTGPKQATSRRW